MKKTVTLAPSLSDGQLALKETPGLLQLASKLAHPAWTHAEARRDSFGGFTGCQSFCDPAHPWREGLQPGCEVDPHGGNFCWSGSLVLDDHVLPTTITVISHFEPIDLDVFGTLSVNGRHIFHVQSTADTATGANLLDCVLCQWRRVRHVCLSAIGKLLVRAVRVGNDFSYQIFPFTQRQRTKCDSSLTFDGWKKFLKCGRSAGVHRNESVLRTQTISADATPNRRSLKRFLCGLGSS